MIFCRSNRAAHTVFCFQNRKTENWICFFTCNKLFCSLFRMTKQVNSFAVQFLQQREFVNYNKSFSYFQRSQMHNIHARILYKVWDCTFGLRLVFRKWNFDSIHSWSFLHNPFISKNASITQPSHKHCPLHNSALPSVVDRKACFAECIHSIAFLAR